MVAVVEPALAVATDPLVTLPAVPTDTESNAPRSYTLTVVGVAEAVTVFPIELAIDGDADAEAVGTLGETVIVEEAVAVEVDAEVTVASLVVLVTTDDPLVEADAEVDNEPDTDSENTVVWNGESRTPVGVTDARYTPPFSVPLLVTLEIPVGLTDKNTSRVGFRGITETLVGSGDRVIDNEGDFGVTVTVVGFGLTVAREMDASRIDTPSIGVVGSTSDTVTFEVAPNGLATLDLTEAGSVIVLVTVLANGEPEALVGVPKNVPEIVGVEEYVDNETLEVDPSGNASVNGSTDLGDTVPEAIVE